MMNDNDIALIQYKIFRFKFMSAPQKLEMIN